MLFENYASSFNWELLPLHGIDQNNRCECGNAHSGDHSAGKHPATSNGLKDASSDPNTIRQWSETYSNFGLYCKSSNIAVIDIDPRNGGFESWESLTAPMQDIIPDTVTALTGEYQGFKSSQRGLHLYFSVPADVQLSGSFHADFPGIDIKHNGYVLLPGSRHFSGVTYEWKPGLGPFEVTLAAMPPYFLSQLDSGRRSAGGSVGVTDLSAFSNDLTHYGKTVLSAECDELARTREGSRNSKLFDAGLKIGSLISGGHIPAETGLEQLVQAAIRIGLSEREAIQTLLRPSGEGALQIGATKPRGPELTSAKTIALADEPEGALPLSPSSTEGTGTGEGPDFLNVVDWEEAFTADYEEPWLVPGLFAAERGHVLYSDAGVGKSLLMLEICAGLASGSSVLGQPPVAPVKILYLDHENSVLGDIVPRLREMGFSHESLNNLVYSSFPNMAALDLAEGGAQLVQALNAVKPDFVVIDTVSRAVDGEENANTTWLRFYNFAGKEFKRREIGYVRLDHVGKSAEQGMRGGSAKKGDVDLIWRLTGSPAGSKFDLKCEKARLPIASKNIALRRNVTPKLSHEVIGTSPHSLDWTELIARNEPFEEALALIRKDEADFGDIGGQKAVWERSKNAAKSAGVTHDVFVTAHRYAKNPDVHEEDETL